jgi:hypothetical protein
VQHAPDERQLDHLWQRWRCGVTCRKWGREVLRHKARPTSAFVDCEEGTRGRARAHMSQGCGNLEAQRRTTRVGSADAPSRAPLLRIKVPGVACPPLAGYGARRLGSR